MITLQQALENVDGVLANATLTRRDHIVLVTSMEVIKSATEPEGDKNGRTDISPNN